MPGPNHDRIEHNLTLHPPKDERVGAVMDTLRGAFKEISHLVDRLVPPGREQSMAFTDLEDGLAHAIAGVARNQDAAVGERS